MKWRTRDWVFQAACIGTCLGALGILAGRGLAQVTEPTPGGPVVTVLSSTSEVWIGVSVTEVPEAVRAHVELPENQGLLVTSVAKDSPADKAGIKVHDILLEAAGKPLANVSDLAGVVQEKKDQAIEIKLLRKGKTETVAVTPQARPAIRWEFPPPFPGTFADPQAWEKWFESFRQRFPGQPPLVFRFYHPGVVIPPDKSLNIPKNMTIVITKEGDKPAKIVVQKDNQKWEVTENELDKLPADVRPHVEKMLRGGGVGGGIEIRPAVPKELEVPRSVIRPRRGSEAEEGDRMEKLEKSLKSLEERLQELEKKLGELLKEKN